MNTALWVTQILLAGTDGLAGTMKAFQTSKAKQTMPWAKERSDEPRRMNIRPIR